VLVAAAITVGLVAATASAGGSTVTTFHLVEKDQTFHFVNNTPSTKNARPAAGDQFVFTGELLTRTGKHAGTLHASCTITAGGNHMVSTCLGTFGLKGGQLQAQTTITDGAKADHIAIVGGTGVYAGTRGEVISVSRGKNSPFSDDTIRLLAA
jgi:hypothetical protein